MPIRKTKKNGKTAYQYGHSGKKYTGPGAKKKAEKQAAAIHASGWQGDKKKKSKGDAKKETTVGKTMKRFAKGELHSGSKKGPVVTKREQAAAIGYSKQRRGDSKAKKRKGKGKSRDQQLILNPWSAIRAQYKAQDAKAQEIFKALDGYDNVISRIGYGVDNPLSSGGYDFNLVTRNRLLLEAAYRGSWVVGAMVDTVAEDMTRAGLDIIAAEDDGDTKKIQASIRRLKLWQSVELVIKWGRMYGGSLGIMDIKGQDLSTPLDIETIGKGQFQGLIAFDRWMLKPLMEDPIDSGPDMGLPSYYEIVSDKDQMSTKPGYESWQNQKVHFSRVLRYTGIDLPYNQMITEFMWGESVLERVWDRLIAFDNATMSSASLIDRANLRTVKIDGLREVLGAGNEAAQTGLYAQFDMMRQVQTNEGLTLLDKDDDFETVAYSFAGLSDMLLQFGQQLAGATHIPLVRLFGQSPAGLNSTGESDMRMYYDGINAKQEAKLRNPWEVLLKVLWQSELGKPAPDDLDFKFNPLWQMNATDKANNAKTQTETIIGAFEAGLTSRKTTLVELKDAAVDTGVFTNITDEEINEAGEDEPPMPDMEPTETDTPGTGKQSTKPVPSFDAKETKKRKWKFWR